MVVQSRTADAAVEIIRAQAGFEFGGTLRGGGDGGCVSGFDVAYAVLADIGGVPCGAIWSGRDGFFDMRGRGVADNNPYFCANGACVASVGRAERHLHADAAGFGAGATDAGVILRDNGESWYIACIQQSHEGVAVPWRVFDERASACDVKVSGAVVRW